MPSSTGKTSVPSLCIITNTFTWLLNRKSMSFLKRVIESKRRNTGKLKGMVGWVVVSSHHAIGLGKNDNHHILLILRIAKWNSRLSPGKCAPRVAVYVFLHVCFVRDNLPVSFWYLKMAERTVSYSVQKAMSLQKPRVEENDKRKVTVVRTSQLNFEEYHLCEINSLIALNWDVQD